MGIINAAGHLPCYVTLIDDFHLTFEHNPSRMSDACQMHVRCMPDACLTFEHNPGRKPDLPFHFQADAVNQAGDAMWGHPI